jgi:hypothetical protein
MGTFSVPGLSLRSRISFFPWSFEYGYGCLVLSIASTDDLLGVADEDHRANSRTSYLIRRLKGQTQFQYCHSLRDIASPRRQKRSAEIGVRRQMLTQLNFPGAPFPISRGPQEAIRGYAHVTTKTLNHWYNAILAICSMKRISGFFVNLSLLHQLGSYFCPLPRMQLGRQTLMYMILNLYYRML